MKPVTIKDIARECGVGKSTVSAALRGDACVRPVTRDLIVATATRMGYDPALNTAARRLVLRHHGQHIINQLIALIFPSTFYQTNYFNSIYWGIMDVLKQHDFSLVTTHAFHAHPQADKVPLPPIFRRGEVDGVIAFPPNNFDTLLDELRNITGVATYPAISLIHRREGCSLILSDDEMGGYLAATHLLDLGHRHLAQTLHPKSAGDISENAICRVDGIHRAMREHALDPATHLHFLEIPTAWLRPDDVLSDEEAAKMPDDRVVEFLRTSPETTAIIANNDAAAKRIWYSLRQADWHVPDDISIIGYDDTDPMQNNLGINQLTTVRVPLREIGRHAAELLIRHINGEIEENEILTLPTELIVRASTAPPKPRRG